MFVEKQFFEKELMKAREIAVIAVSQAF